MAWLAAYYLRFYSGLVPVTKGIPPLAQYSSVVVPVIFVWLFVFTSFRIYRPPILVRGLGELVLLIRAHAVALLLFIALTYMVSEYKYSRVTLAYFFVISMIYFVQVRKFLIWMLPGVRAKLGRVRNVLVVGGGQTAKRVSISLLGSPEFGLKFRGFVTADGLLDSNLGEENNLSGGPLLGRYEDLAKIIEQNNVSIVFFALPRADSAHTEHLLRVTETLPVEVKIVPDLSEFITLGCGVDTFEGLPLITFNSTEINLAESAIKRLLDIFGATFALVLFSPLFLVLTLLVKFTSRGPIFYGQRRMGLDGKVFRMWKFRSMRVNAEEASGPVWAKADDDRRTSIGAFLRSTSLDEIPQFWNVLLGEMSLVGPRPERPEFVSKFRNDIPKYMLRHRVKSGITGWAQVNGWRGDTSLEKRIEFDLYYIQHWSIIFDIKILLLTVLKGFVNKNAY